MVVTTPAQLPDVQPLHQRTFLCHIRPPDGFTAGGQLYVKYHEALPPVTARVLKTHPTCTVRENDVVRFRKNAFDTVDLVDGRSFAVMHEGAVDAVLDGFDQEIPLEVPTC